MLMLILFMILSILSNALANITLKIGASKLAGLSWQQPWQSFLKIIADIPLVAGAVFFVFSFACYIYILNQANVSLVYPILTSLALVLITLISVFYLHESLRIIQIIGIAVIILGVWLVSHK